MDQNGKLTTFLWIFYFLVQTTMVESSSGPIKYNSGIDLQWYLHSTKTLAVANLHSKILDVYLPPRSNFLHSHAVFSNFWPDNRLVPPFQVGAPSAKSWIHCWLIGYNQKLYNTLADFVVLNFIFQSAMRDGPW